MFESFRKNWMRSLIGSTLLLVAASGCASTSKYDRLLETHRQLKQDDTRQIERLSRENKVLYEAKIELEKEQSLLKNSLENAQAQLEAERRNQLSFRESNRQKLDDLERQLANLEEKTSRKVKELSLRNRTMVDSLVQQVDSLAAQLTDQSSSHSNEVRLLKNELAKRKFDYEKEVYALTRLKEELFAQLQQKQREIEQLRGQARIPFASTVDTVARQ
jgi:chromosome segregation ATPase